MKERSSKKLNFNGISENEKSHLKDRITSSVYRYIQRKRRTKYSIGAAAAVVVLFLSVEVFNNVNNNISPIDNFVKTLDNIEQELSEDVKLILGNNQKINITEDHSTITYSNTGEDIRIGETKSVNQSASKNQKVVFNTLIVPYGKRSEIELSDGSKIWLNSGSKLVFPASFSGDKREVYLEGEGIFEVAHNKEQPFIVKSNNHEIEVLGTVFNVSNYTDDNSINTVLKSGSVQINFKNDGFLNNKESVKMTPGTLAVYNRNSKDMSINKVDTEKYFSWRDGMLIFKNDSMDFIMKKISRYYNTEIVINNEALKTVTFSGALDLQDNMEDVIKTIEETTGFEYKMETNKLIIN